MNQRNNAFPFNSNNYFMNDPNGYKTYNNNNLNNNLRNSNPSLNNYNNNYLSNNNINFNNNININFNSNLNNNNNINKTNYTYILTNYYCSSCNYRDDFTDEIDTSGFRQGGCDHFNLSFIRSEEDDFSYEISVECKNCSNTKDYQLYINKKNLQGELITVDECKHSCCGAEISIKAILSVGDINDPENVSLFFTHNGKNYNVVGRMKDKLSDFIEKLCKENPKFEKNKLRTFANGRPLNINKTIEENRLNSSIGIILIMSKVNK